MVRTKRGSAETECSSAWARLHKDLNGAWVGSRGEVYEVLIDEFSKTWTCFRKNEYGSVPYTLTWDGGDNVTWGTDYILRLSELHEAPTRPTWHSSKGKRPFIWSRVGSPNLQSAVQRCGFAKACDTIEKEKPVERQNMQTRPPAPTVSTKPRTGVVSSGPASRTVETARARTWNSYKPDQNVARKDEPAASAAAVLLRRLRNQGFEPPGTLLEDEAPGIMQSANSTECNVMAPSDSEELRETKEQLMQDKYQAKDNILDTKLEKWQTELEDVEQCRSDSTSAPTQLCNIVECKWSCCRPPTPTLHPRDAEQTGFSPKDVVQEIRHPPELDFEASERRKVDHPAENPWEVLPVDCAVQALFYGEWYDGFVRSYRDDVVEVLWAEEYSVSFVPRFNVRPKSASHPKRTGESDSFSATARTASEETAREEDVKGNSKQKLNLRQALDRFSNPV